MIRNRMQTETGSGPPADDGEQFVDRGNEYLSAICMHDSVQRRQAETSENLLSVSR